MKIVPFVLSLAVAQRGWFGNHLDSKGFLIPRGLFKADAASHVAAGPIDLDKIDLDEIARGKGRNDGDLGEKGKKRLTEKVSLIHNMLLLYQQSSTLRHFQELTWSLKSHNYESYFGFLPSYPYVQMSHHILYLLLYSLLEFFGTFMIRVLQARK